MGKRELIALLNLSSWCHMMVEQLFLAVPRGCLQFVIVVFPDHTYLLLSFKIQVMAVYGHYPPSVQTVDGTLNSRQATSQPSSNLVSATRNIDSTVHDSVS